MTHTTSCDRTRSVCGCCDCTTCETHSELQNQKWGDEYEEYLKKEPYWLRGIDF